jgi:hypothetical protein
MDSFFHNQVTIVLKKLIPETGPVMIKDICDPGLNRRMAFYGGIDGNITSLRVSADF